VTVIGELLGIPAADRAMFADLARDWSAVLDVLSPQVVDRADAAATVIADYLSDLATQRREHPADDLISAMAAADGGDKLTADELVTMAALLLKAGSETTSGLLSNGLAALLARLEAQVAFPALLARFPRLALAGEPVCRDGAMVHGHASLPITAR